MHVRLPSNFANSLEYKSPHHLQFTTPTIMVFQWHRTLWYLSLLWFSSVAMRTMSSADLMSVEYSCRTLFWHIWPRERYSLILLVHLFSYSHSHLNVWGYLYDSNYSACRMVCLLCTLRFTRVHRMVLDDGCTWHLLSPCHAQKKAMRLAVIGMILMIFKV